MPYEEINNKWKSPLSFDLTVENCQELEKVLNTLAVSDNCHDFGAGNYSHSLKGLPNDGKINGEQVPHKKEDEVFEVIFE